MIAVVLPGVYAPQDDTELPAEALREEAPTAGAYVLDLGTGSGALALARSRMYDLIPANPPYVPAPDAGHIPRVRSRAWDAGRGGRLLDRICRDAPALLRPGGVLLTVRSALSDPGRTLEPLRAAGLKAAVVRRRWIALGPVLRSREDWLRRRGLLAPDEEREELVVIRAERIR